MVKRQFFSIKIFSSLAVASIFFLLLAVFSAWKAPIFSVEVNSFLKMMSLGTATCLLLLSSAVLINLHCSHFIVKFLSLIVLLIAAVRFWELTSASRYLDSAFVLVTGISLDHQDGAMSSLTSACLAMLAVSVFFSADAKSQQGKFKNWVSLILIFYVVFLVTVALSGYFLNLMLAYTWMGMRMSPHTAVALLILSIVICIMNFRLALNVIYKTSVKQRFLLGVLVVFFFGAIIFIILQQQINYVGSINQRAIVNLAKPDHANFVELQKLIKTEYEIKELTLVLISGFALVCVLLFSWIFFSLTYQLKRLSHLLLDSTRYRFTDPANIPYLGDATEFGVIADSIESFMDLHKSQQRLQLRLQKIIESMPNGVVMINQQGIIDLVNEKICMTFEYTREELLGKSVEMLIPKATEYPELWVSFFQQSDTKTAVVKQELLGLTKNNRKVALEIGLVPIESEHGIQVLASIVDVSEKKMTEKNLALSHEKIEVTSRALGIGIWEFNPDTNKLTWDDTMFSLYEVDPDVFTGTYEFWRSKIHPDDVEDQEKKFIHAIDNHLEFVAKFRIMVAGDKIKYIQAKAKVEHDDYKNETRIIGSNFDITREELVIRKFQQLDTLRASIVEYSEDAIVSKTLEGNITSWNKAAEKMFGYSEQEAIGKNIKDLIILPDKLQEYEGLIKQVVQGKVIINHQSKALCKNGKSIDLSFSLSPIKDEQGNIVSISSIKRDISEAIKSANKLLEHQKELERSNKSLETFAYVASHDLKAPLRGISQLSNWLEEDIRDNKFETLSETSKKIKIRIKRMEALLDDLLAYYRVEKMQGFYKIMDVRQSVVDIFNMNNNKAGLTLEIENNLPVFATYVTPVEQVFSNLISNAIKHHDKLNGVIRISVKEVNGDWYEFSVFDDGPGINPQFHQRIFNMFQTLKPRDEVEGSGMGLALVKKIIEQYGGQVGIDSEFRGSRFYFTWPKSIKRAES